ncbi:hypothetical protein ABZ883_14710 [Streptomyces sp. NPDC046977]|uniref:hypothetical protein n=1 Tax=Streptomyces sp. NPDC046977 TaxID=3154703 RepID=UPI0033F1FEC2
MTADAYLTIRCDDSACDAEGSWPVRHDPHTHRELRRLLKGHGWRRTRDGRDLCPDHAPAPAVSAA